MWNSKDTSAMAKAYAVLLALPRGPQARGHLAGESLQAGVHLRGSQARGHRPRHQVGDAVLGDEGRELGDAVLDVAHHPGLGNARAGAIPGALLTRLGEEPVVELAAVPLGRAHRRPLALGVVRDEAGADDAHAPRLRRAPGRPPGRAPGVEDVGTLALRQQVGVEARGAGGAG